MKRKFVVGDRVVSKKNPKDNNRVYEILDLDIKNVLLERYFGINNGIIVTGEKYFSDEKLCYAVKCINGSPAGRDRVVLVEKEVFEGLYEKITPAWKVLYERSKD